MPSTSDNARLAYSEASGELFDQSLFLSAKVPTTFATEDGAAELYLVDSTYALIAEAVGRLDVDLVPGQYQVRQRVGNTESIHEFQVSAELPASFSLPRLDFATPIPLPKSSLAKDTGLEHRVLEAQKGNFRLLLWTPVSGGPLLVGALAKTLETLSLETFDGQRIPLKAESNDHSAWIALDLNPGSYVLVQRVAPNRQRCLPLRIARGLVTAVYLVLLRDDSGNEIPLELEHGAITLLPSSMKGDEVVGPLRRLEAARKALALGREVSGWSAWGEAGSAENPLLALIDGHLPGASAPVDDVLGDAELMASSIAPGQPQSRALTGPPLLRRSWSLLWKIPSGNAALLALFPFDYTVEGSNTWFIWSEAPKARASQALARRAVARKTLSSIWSLAFVFLSKRPHKSSKQHAKAHGVPNAPTYEDLVQLFTRLVESPMTSELLRKTYQESENRNGGENDHSVQRMFSALETMADKTLLKAMGAQYLVSSALRSLEIPDDRLAEHARSLLWLLLQQMSEEDRKYTVELIGAAGHWLREKTSEQRPQEQLGRPD